MQKNMIVFVVLFLGACAHKPFKEQLAVSYGAQVGSMMHFISDDRSPETQTLVEVSGGQGSSYEIVQVYTMTMFEKTSPQWRRDERLYIIRLNQPARLGEVEKYSSKYSYSGVDPLVLQQFAPNFRFDGDEAPFYSLGFEHNPVCPDCPKMAFVFAGRVWDQKELRDDYVFREGTLFIARHNVR